jgi:hypothetical protein
LKEEKGGDRKQVMLPKRRKPQAAEGAVRLVSMSSCCVKLKEWNLRITDPSRIKTGFIT